MRRVKIQRNFHADSPCSTPEHRLNCYFSKVRTHSIREDRMALKMRVHDREPIGAALRRFKKLLERSGMKRELRAHEHYEKQIGQPQESHHQGRYGRSCQVTGITHPKLEDHRLPGGLRSFMNCGQSLGHLRTTDRIDSQPSKEMSSDASIALRAATKKTSGSSRRLFCCHRLSKYTQ
jgi:ribosomal protein S21